jgi:hypothetical protein
MYSVPDGRNHTDVVHLPSDQTPAFTAVFDFKTVSTRLIDDRDGELGDWHISRPRHLTMILRGIFDIDTDDGKVYRFPAGSVLLAENTAGRGHRTVCHANNPEKICMLLATNLAEDEMVLPKEPTR